MQGYRTYVAAALVTLGGLIAQTDWINFLANPKAGAVALGSAAVFAILRGLTTTPPGTAPTAAAAPAAPTPAA